MSFNFSIKKICSNLANTTYCIGDMLIASQTKDTYWDTKKSTDCLYRWNGIKHGYCKTQPHHLDKEERKQFFKSNSGLNDKEQAIADVFRIQYEDSTFSYVEYAASIPGKLILLTSSLLSATASVAQYIDYAKDFVCAKSIDLISYSYSSIIGYFNDNKENDTKLNDVDNVYSLNKDSNKNLVEDNISETGWLNSTEESSLHMETNELIHDFITQDVSA